MFVAHLVATIILNRLNFTFSRRKNFVFLFFIGKNNELIKKIMKNKRVT